MNDLRKYIDILENASQDELQKYRDEQKYWQNVFPELMAQYNDGSHTEKLINGTLVWYKNGELHRDGDKSAVIGDGSLVWYKNGQRHRDGDKPAVIGGDGSLKWWQNDQLHRFGGPAVIHHDGTLWWYWRQYAIPVKSQEEFIDYLKKHKGMQRFRVTGK